MEEQAQSLIDQTSMHFTLTSIYLRDNYFSQKLLCAHDVSATLESRNWIIIWLSTNYIKKNSLKYTKSWYEINLYWNF